MLLPCAHSPAALLADDGLRTKLTSAGMLPAVAEVTVAELGKLPAKLEQQVMPKPQTAIALLLLHGKVSCWWSQSGGCSGPHSF
jgi:hypothetical protein